MSEDKSKDMENKCNDNNDEDDNQENIDPLEARKNEILGILLIAFGLFSAFAIFTSSTGMLGSFLSDIYFQITGIGTYILPVLLIIWGITLIHFKGLCFNSKLSGFLLTYIVTLAIIHTYLYPGFELDHSLPQNAGGFIGGGISWFLMKIAGEIGTYIILGAFLLIGLLLWFDILLKSIFKKIGDTIIRIIKIGKNIVLFQDNSNKNSKENEEETSDNYFEDYTPEAAATIETLKNESEEQDFELIISGDDEETTVAETSQNKIEKEDKMNESKEVNINESYSLPGINVLKKPGRKKVKLENKSELLEETLQSFGVEASVIEVSHGPTITRYEVQPASGVKVSKIVSLSDDIALALAASDVRIEAPIPGKAAVGIEVPHSSNIIVHIREIIASKKFQNSKSKLTLALGKGIDGKPVVTDLSKMPHLLVAGATGSGKSVSVNTMIASILYKATPEEVKLILIDPKKVELINYQGLPHLFSPVVTDPKKASNVLKLVVEEMEKRYDLFSESGTRGITSYNKKIDEEDRLPYIVVIIDELSDLMMVAANEVEDNICRLAQMSRAAGIHLIIATQRPSVDVITGLIKANIPSRMSFAVSSQTDSRTILDMGGAEKLLGNGDMLFAPVDAKKPQRIQGGFIKDEEIYKLVEYVKKQTEPDYEVELEDLKKVEISIDNEKDELYEEAVKLVVKHRASISMLQRRLHVGHSRAARMIDTMEDEGIVGSYAGSKPREVLISEEELENHIDINENNKKDNDNINNEEEIEDEQTGQKE